MTQPDEPITFEATTTVDDLIAAHRHLTAKTTRAAKRRRFRGRMAFYPALFFFPMGAVVLGSSDPAAAFKVVSRIDFWLHMISYIAVVGLLAFGGGRLWLLLTSALMRSTFVDTRRNNPAVDRRDPGLSLKRTYRFDETGFLTKTPDDEIWDSWARVTGLDETATLLIVKVGAGTGYPLPKAQLTSELQERLTLFIAARATSKWPF